MQWFQYQLLHHFLPTNRRLFKIQYIDCDRCSYCSHALETIEHLFYDCSRVNPIWNSLEKWLNTKLELNLNFSKEQILLGFFGKSNDPVNVIIILFKTIIFRHKKSKQVPNFEFFKQSLKNYYQMTKYSEQINLSVDKFFKFWSICHLLFTE